MQKTIKTDENGVSKATNWVLDDVIEAFEKRGLNNGDNDELIKELTIQKMEYVRLGTYQVLAYLGQNQDMINYWNRFDPDIQKKIVELGGTPKKINFD